MNLADAQAYVVRVTNNGHTATMEQIVNLQGPTGVWKVTARALDAAVGVTLNAAKVVQDGTPGIVGTVREVIYI